MNIEPATR